MQLIPSEYILASFFPLGMRSFLSGFSVHSGFSHPLFNFLRHRTEPRMGRTENLSRAQLSSCKEGITDSGEQCKAVMGWASPAAKRISFSQINISLKVRDSMKWQKESWPGKEDIWTLLFFLAWPHLSHLISLDFSFLTCKTHCSLRSLSCYLALTLSIE